MLVFMTGTGIAVTEGSQHPFRKELQDHTLIQETEHVRFDSATKEQVTYDPGELDPDALKGLFDRETYSLILTNSEGEQESVWSRTLEFASLFYVSIAQAEKLVVLDVLEREDGILVFCLNRGKLLLEIACNFEGEWQIIASHPIGTRRWRDLAPVIEVTDRGDRVVVSVESRDTAIRETFVYADGAVSAQDTASEPQAFSRPLQPREIESDNPRVKEKRIDMEDGTPKLVLRGDYTPDPSARNTSNWQPLSPSAGGHHASPYPDVFRILAQTPQLRELARTDLSESDMEGIIQRNNLRVERMLLESGNSYHLFAENGENVIVMFSPDGSWRGTQRMLPNPPGR